MKISKLEIKNMYGISHKELDGTSIELTGTNGVGKSSVLDAIRFALTNNSTRKYIVKNGEREGEVFIETDSGLSIDRKKRTDKSDYKSVKNNGVEVGSPETFLKDICSPLQLNPVEFVNMTEQEQNRVILDLIEFEWDKDYIISKFGELPAGVNYDTNILEVLNQIQSKNGMYYQERENFNRDIRNNLAAIEDIAKDIPTKYDALKWEDYDLGAKYRELSEMKDHNDKISRAVVFKQNYDNTVNGYKGEKDSKIADLYYTTNTQKENIKIEIEQLKAKIALWENKLLQLDDSVESTKKIFELEFNEKVAKLDSGIKVAEEYILKEVIDTKPLEDELNIVETMKRHLNEYRRMTGMQLNTEVLRAQSQDLTDKIELARQLPGEILKTAKLPVESLTVVDGIPLIDNKPISNLSEGEKLLLCISIALSKPNSLRIILIDGTEKLSEKNRNELYRICKEKGLQVIASRTTDSDDLIITEL